MFFDLGLVTVAAATDRNTETGELTARCVPGWTKGIFALHRELGDHDDLGWQVSEQLTGLALGRPFDNQRDALMALRAIGHIWADSVDELKTAIEPFKHLFRKSR